MNSNLVIYRKYRPRTFAEVVGQEHLVKTLIYAIGQGRPAHAYLFSGTRGVGKTTIARLIAKAVNCQDPTTKHEPCNRCDNCLSIERAAAVDLLELDAASHRGIEEAKELIESVKYPPANLPYKVFIIDEVHMLTREAFNSLLKTLEEPPNYAIFILATTEPQKIPQTIISRCQYFELKRLTPKQILIKVKKILEQEKIKMEPRALDFIARGGRGSLRDTESLLEQIISQRKKEIKWQDLEEILGIVSPEAVSRFVKTLLAKDTQKTIALVHELFERGKDMGQLNLQLVAFLRLIILAKIDRKLLKVHNLNENDEEEILALAKMATEDQLMRLIRVFVRAFKELNHYPSAEISTEIAVVEGEEILKD